MCRIHITVWTLCLISSSFQNESGQDYYDYYQDADEIQSHLEPYILRVRELVDLLYPEHHLIQQCLRRKADRMPSEAAEWNYPWGNMKEAAIFARGLTPEAIKNIMLEYEKTRCTPREVCLDISREFPQITNKFYKPSCVLVHRCGGCCDNEALHCTNTSYSFISKTVLEHTNFQPGQVIDISFVNHTECSCRLRSETSHPSRSIIRRSAEDSSVQCSETDASCPDGQLWDTSVCKCVSDGEPALPAMKTGIKNTLGYNFCGHNMIFDEENCECVCENGVTQAMCEGRQRHFDESSCNCVCLETPEPEGCPAGQRWDEENCKCVCRSSCPKGWKPNAETCQCECQENSDSCRLQGKKFNHKNCSCYRLPCRTPNKKCKPGDYFSHYVCQCLPEYMKVYEVN